MRIIGIDPGLTATGYAVIQADESGEQFVAGGLIRTHTRDLTNRLEQIFSQILKVLGQYQPEVLALEELYSKYHHPRTAILMGHARGVICLAAAKMGIPLTGYAASQVKRALTGNGNASKEQVQAAVMATLGLSDPLDDNVSDALALAICHHYRQASRAKLEEAKAS